MKILQINSVCGIRSTGRICTDLADILTEQGHECKIAYGRETVPEKYQKYAVRIGNDLDVNMHALKTRVFDDCGFGSRSATKKFIKWVKAYDPDIIHLHNLHGYYINIEVLFAYLKKADKPVIWTLHDCWAFTGHCVHFDFIGCDKWENGCGSCSQKHEYPKSAGLDNSAGNYRRKKQLFTAAGNVTIVTPSIWLSKLVKKSFLSKYNVKVINNGINLDAFKPTESDFREKNGLQDKKIVLGVASVWDERKGIGTFIELSKLLSEDYKLLMVGVSDEKAKSLPENIYKITCTHDVFELAEIYSAADVFVNPTMEDNYPTVNLEAIACGTPVITFDTGGSPESCVDGIDTVCSQKTVAALHDAIITLTGKGKKAAVRNDGLSCRDMAKKYLDLYSDIFLDK